MTVGIQLSLPLSWNQRLRLRPAPISRRLEPIKHAQGKQNQRFLSSSTTAAGKPSPSICSSLQVVGSSPKSVALNALTISRSRNLHFPAECGGWKYVTFAGKSTGELSFDDDFRDDPLWLSLIKETIRALKSLLDFLVEQPSQLKYLEWPGFRSTLKTATLTLVLVALLILALSSIDSFLSYLLALLLRKTL